MITDLSFMIIGGVFAIVVIIFAYCAAPFFWKRKPDV
jgi:hypothetical protein